MMPWPARAAAEEEDDPVVSAECVAWGCAVWAEAVWAEAAATAEDNPRKKKTPTGTCSAWQRNKKGGHEAPFLFCYSITIRVMYECCCESTIRTK